jgi:hypothetical protein
MTETTNNQLAIAVARIETKLEIIPALTVAVKDIQLQVQEQAIQIQIINQKLPKKHEWFQITAGISTIIAIFISITALLK